MASRRVLGAPLVEGLFVLAGILGAFSVEAWWSWRGDRLDESARLTAVRSELLEAREGYEAHLGYLDQQNEYAAAILREAQAYSGLESRLDSLLFRLGPFSEFQPPTAALEDATGPGGFAVIRSAAVRQGLARYRALVERDYTEQLYVRDTFQREMSPLWQQYVNTRDVMATGAYLPEGYPRVEMPSLYEDLLKDRRFLNQVSARTIGVGRVRTRHANTLEQLDELVEVLSGAH